MYGYSNSPCSLEDFCVIWCFVSPCNSGDRLEVSYESVQRSPNSSDRRTWKLAHVFCICCWIGGGELCAQEFRNIFSVIAIFIKIGIVEAMLY